MTTSRPGAPTAPGFAGFAGSAGSAGAAGAPAEAFAPARSTGELTTGGAR